MKRLKLSFTYLLLLHATFLYSQSYKYESKITFIASSRFGKVQGEFQKTNIVVTTNKIGSQVFVDVSSIYTGNKLRDNHLREEDFFYVSKYPYATLSLTSITKISETTFRCTGNLAIKDKKKEITFPLNVERTANGYRYLGEMEIDRTEFGINYNSLINPISEKVLVQYQIFEKLE